MATQKRPEKHLHQLLLGVAEISHLLAGDDLETQLPRVLSVLGQVLDLGRIYLSHFHQEPTGLRLSQYSEWCAAEVKPFQDSPEAHNRVPYEPIRQRLLAGEILTYTSSNIPAPLKALSSYKNAKSVLKMPIFVDEKLWGYISFVDYHLRQWNEEEINALKITTSSIGRAFSRIQSEAALRQNEERFRGAGRNLA